MKNPENNPIFSPLYYEENPKGRIADTILVLFLVIIVLFIPLPYGSVQYFFITVIQMVALVCLIFWVLKLVLFSKETALIQFQQLHENEKQALQKLGFFHKHHLLARLARLITLGKCPGRYDASNLIHTIPERCPRHLSYFSLFGYPVKNTGVEKLAVALLATLCFQIIPLPASLVAFLSPATYDLYHSASSLAGKTLNFYPLSMDTFATFSKILEYSAYFIIYLVLVNTVRKRPHYRMILYAIFVSAAFQAIYGLYEFLSGQQQVFGYRKQYNLDSATGTFLNRNHYAAYLEMPLILLISLVVGRVSMLRAFRGSVFVRIARTLETEVAGKIVMLLLTIVLVAVALIFSLSRSGISFAIISLITFYYVYWRTTGKLSHRSYWILTLSCALAISVWIGLNPLLGRFLNIPQDWASGGARWQVWKDTFYLFLHFPIAGTGAGTFAQVYPMQRSFYSNIFYEHAHNDYLQFLSEVGLLAFIFFAAFFVLILEQLRRVLSEEWSRLSVIQVGAFCSLLSLALHSFTDFTFQIPAIAMQGTIIAGLFFTTYHDERAH